MFSNGSEINGKWNELCIFGMINVINSFFFLGFDLLQANNYDHHAAIYLLLLERIRTRSISQDSTVGCIAAPNNQAVNRASDVDLKNTLSEAQRRRSSSIAEQAMRKLSTGSNYGGPYFNVPEQSIPHIDVRENGHVTHARVAERDIDGEPRETISPLPGTGAYNSSRLSSNRMLSVGLDKRIMKQSTEDCRRLLQQVSVNKMKHIQSSSLRYNSTFIHSLSLFRSSYL